MPEPVGNGLYRCSGPCGRSLPLGWFCKNGTDWGGRPKYTSNCRECRRPRRLNDKSIRRQREKVARIGNARVTEEQLQQILARQGYLCACGCGRSVLFERHWDHKIPLAKGGKHCVGNLQAMAPICNLKKSDRYAL